MLELKLGQCLFAGRCGLLKLIELLDKSLAKILIGFKLTLNNTKKYDLYSFQYFPKFN